MNCAEEMSNDTVYPGRIDPKDRLWEFSPWTELLKERYSIAALFCERKIVLDTCCGTGWGTFNYIVPCACFTIGFDICRPKAEASDKNRYLFVVMDAVRTGLKKNSFDVILALDSIEHFTYEKGIEYLLEMKNVSNQNGMIVGTTPLVVDNSLISTYLGWNKYHLCMYTRKSLRDTLESIFPVVKIYEIYNKVCPYFLFLCSKSKNNVERETEKINKFISGKEKEFKEGKILGYLTWSKSLIKKGELFKAIYFFSTAIFIKMGIFRYGNKSNSVNVCL